MKTVIFKMMLFIGVLGLATYYTVSKIEFVSGNFQSPIMFSGMLFGYAAATLSNSLEEFMNYIYDKKSLKNGRMKESL
jgi:hypothetical protein